MTRERRTMGGFLSYVIDEVRIAVGGFLREARPLCQRYPDFKIGRGCYGPLKVETFDDGANLTVGAFCSFAKGVVILLGGEHRDDWISTYPFDRRYFCDQSLPHSSFARGDVVIGNDVWIGLDTVILSGTTIGDGAIVGARSVVRGNIPPYAVCAGSPARVLRYRFDAEKIAALLALKWWDWPDEKIQKAIPILNSADIEALEKLNR